MEQMLEIYLQYEAITESQRETIRTAWNCQMVPVIYRARVEAELASRLAA